VSPTKRWIVVLGWGGEVLGAERGAPPEWVGAPLADRPDAPASLQDAARSVTAAARRGELLPRTEVQVPELGAVVELCAIPAVGLRRTETEIRPLFAHALAALERQAHALDVALSIAVDPGVPETVVLDPEKIGWVVSALVGNAMRYVRRGTRHMPGGTIAVAAILDAEKGEILLIVEDDGPGIPGPVVERLFRRDGARLPAGLGLVLVRDIVEAQGGSVEVTSSTDDVDHGTTVTVRLPVA
jgi:signal transduction histidine kinase